MSRSFRLEGFEQPKQEPSLPEQHRNSFAGPTPPAEQFGPGESFVRRTGPDGDPAGAYWARKEAAANIETQGQYRNAYAVKRQFQKELTHEHEITIQPGEQLTGYRGPAAKQIECRGDFYQRYPGGEEQIIFPDRESVLAQGVKTRPLDPSAPPAEKANPCEDGEFRQKQTQLRQASGREQVEAPTQELPKGTTPRI